MNNDSQIQLHHEAKFLFFTTLDGKINIEAWYAGETIWLTQKQMAELSDGYRVNSMKATSFRKWTTQVLHEYMIKDFAVDDERLKNSTHFGKDHSNELLERIREIRMSERRLYLQITDIFALAIDYDTKSELVREFFAFIQNKLHYAITGKTAAEIIYGRADKDAPSMGLSKVIGSWCQRAKFYVVM